MSDTDAPRLDIEHYDLSLTVQGGSQDSLEDVQSVFQEELESAIERDPKLGDGDPVPTEGYE